MIAQLLILKKLWSSVLIPTQITYLVQIYPTVHNIVEDVVFKALKKMMDPDLIPLVITRDCASVFVPILIHIFNLMSLSSKFPGSWMLSKVYPVHKTGMKL